MFLKEYISKIKSYDNLTKNKGWLDYSSIINHVIEDIPNDKVEEWKNFKTNHLSKVNWKVTLENSFSNRSFAEKTPKSLNSIVFLNGYYDTTLSSLEKGIGINIYTISEYLKIHPEFKKTFYNNPRQYAENRLSGHEDKKPIYFISLNSLLSTGVVIEIERGRKISNTINLIHIFSDDSVENIINPYITIVSRDNSEANFQEIFNETNCWNNNFTEVFIENDAKLKFTKLQNKLPKGIKTSSLSCHLDRNSELDLKVINREKCKEDIRIYLNRENSSAKVAGILLSNVFAQIFLKPNVSTLLSSNKFINLLFFTYIYSSKSQNII